MVIDPFIYGAFMVKYKKETDNNTKGYNYMYKSGFTPNFPCHKWKYRKLIY